MQLTKLDRANLYAMMIAEIDEPLIDGWSMQFGLCRMAWEIFEIRLYYGAFKRILPELCKQRPTLFDRFWFPRTRIGWQQRRICLLKAIELCN